MDGRTEYAEYLAEAREQICEPCRAEVPGATPFRARCRYCGIELRLPELVESIHDAADALTEFGPAPDPLTVCARCPCLDGGICPCPAAFRTVELVRVVKAVDERRRQRDAVRRLLRRQERHGAVPVAAIIRAYERTTGACVCCD
jgi:hypothetical protein